MAEPSQTLHQQQLALTRYLRDPEHVPVPAGMNPVRAQVYRELIFENMRSLLSGTFPVLISVLGQDRWRTCVRGFLRDHRCTSPRFAEIAGEFVGYLATAQAPDWPPFMAELAHYEWVEMALLQSDAESLPAGDEASLLDRPLHLSALAWPLAYQWPVHRLAPDYQPATPPSEPTLLLVRRTAGFEVRFSELSPLAWRLLQRIEAFPELDGREQLLALAREAGAGSFGFMEDAMALLRKMQEEGVVGISTQSSN
ncbi:putative DNA-binding domain-containing protein [Pseudomonas sp. RGM2987]|uniref:HvfC family RiPP maturation protein n=1 Tax=Pseudomonas sp. RGM2987 TaxID=2930090 RepID=UPI001FD69647|nr:putative DNA-binding domain-containing protein [Pseudomonas sp. RGM2987]MCJ8208056.1 putative DNA-binding domain-containing protein [Pseudomonas sp. RGM2987]